MRGKNILLLTAILGTSFLGGTILGQNAAKKVETEYVTQETGEPVWKENKSISNESVESPLPTLTATPKPVSYFLVLSDREICVYELPPSGNATFIYAQDVEVSQLRQEDYERLCRGIKVATSEEARTLTEDFGS